MLTKSKKAQERVSYAPFEIIIAIIIGAAMLGAAYAAARGEPYEKLYFAKDMAVKLNALHAIEGDFNLIYSPTNLDKYSYKIKNGLVTVAKGNFEDPARAEFHFIPNKNTNKIDMEFRNPSSLTFIKRGNIISIVENAIQPEKTGIICPETNYKDSNWRREKTILIDPSANLPHGYLLTIAELLRARINPDRVMLVSQDADKIQIFSEINPDILLILKISNENMPKITSSYKNTYENYILSCLLRKEFHESYNIEPNRIFSDSNLLLNQAENTLAIKIEINPAKYQDPEKIANMVYNAIKNYYE